MNTKLQRILVPGTFDPITKGHLDIITRACALSPEVIVGVAESRSKRGGPCFSLQERLEFAKEACAELKQVKVMSFNCLLVDFAQEIGAQAVVKGLRALTDFEYEFQQAAINYHLDRELETLFIMSNPNYSYLSSSLIKELVQFGGDIEQLVTPGVFKALKKKFNAASGQNS